MNQVIHIFRGGSADPTTNVVPARIMVRMEQILDEAKSKKD